MSINEERRNRRSVIVIVIIIVKTFLDDTTSRLSTYLRCDLTIFLQQYLLTVTTRYVLAITKRNKMEAHDGGKVSDQQ